MASVKNACAGPLGGAYDACIERERVARILEQWLHDAGLTDIDTTPGGAFVLFAGRKQS